MKQNRTSNLKEPWFWVVVGLPAVVVLACFYMLYLAISTNDGVVSDDYYKEGLAINQDLRRDDKARAYGLVGELVLADGSAKLRLRSNEQVAQSLSGQPLALFLQNLGAPERDQNLTLLPVAGEIGTWRAVIPEMPSKGHWQIQVQTSEWRLMKRVDGELNQVIVLD